MQYQFMAMASRITVEIDNPACLQLLRRIWPSDSPIPPIAGQDQHYIIQCTGELYTLISADKHRDNLSSRELLYQLDKSILIQLQKNHPALYFLHGAVLAKTGICVLLTGSSGAGKSSLALALASAPEAWQLMSDELAPITPECATVFPYRRALELKTAPPHPLKLPAGHVAVEDRFHIPNDTLPQSNCPAQTRLSTAFSIAGQFSHKYRVGEQLSRSDATLIFLRNLLNSLAHPGNGLPTAIAMAQTIPCFNIPRMPIEQALSLVNQISEARRQF
ncbi:MAG: hypothetical protein ACSHXK_10890 [Oceanococcus sp.]